MQRWALESSLVWVAALALGCGPDSAEPAECERKPVATFRVVVRAEMGTLPADTAIVVAYGGGDVEYRLSSPTSADDVFCRHASPDGGTPESDAATLDAGRDDAGAVLSSVDALSCTLWTSGAAAIEVTAAGYLPIEENLVAERDPKCGDIVTTRIDIVLSRGDAGA